MLTEHIAPEKEVQAKSSEELRELLETEFRSSYLSTTLERLGLCPDGHIEVEGQRLPYTQGFLEAIAKTIGMPLQYAYRIDFDLFRDNFDQRKEKCSKAIVLCVNRGIAINLADADYRAARTRDLLYSSGGDDSLDFLQALVSDRGVELSLVDHTLTVDPQPGDTIRIGIRLSNSETGYRGLKASLFTHRLVCSNGAVMADELGTARWNYDRRVTYQASVDKFQKDLCELEERLVGVKGLYDGIVDRNLLDREFVHLWRRMRHGLLPETVDQILGVDLQERRALQHTVRDRLPGAQPMATEWGVYDVHNRITSAAQQRGFVVRRRLEEIGGGLLSAVSMN